MEQTKRPYEPPVIGRIVMIVEESLMTPCKVTNGDPAGTGNKTCGHNQCKVTFGS